MLYKRKSTLLRKSESFDEAAHVMVPITIQVADDSESEWKELDAILDTGCQVPLWLPPKVYKDMGGRTNGKGSSTVIDGSTVDHEKGKLNLRIGGKELEGVDVCLGGKDLVIVGLPILAKFNVSLKGGKAYLRSKD